MGEQWVGLRKYWLKLPFIANSGTQKEEKIGLSISTSKFTQT